MQEGRPPKKINMMLPGSPLAFADPDLEARFVRRQRSSFIHSARLWVMFQILVTSVISVRMWAQGLGKWRLLLLASSSIAAWLSALAIILSPHSESLYTWLITGIGMYLHHHLWGVPVSPLSILCKVAMAS